jgi:tRNA pseudouridine38-40 synthase
MRRVGLVVQYDGTAYAGFQIQPAVATVQGELERALGNLLGEEVRVAGASRTDAGVHAQGQVVTFTTENPLPLERLPRALNDRLPGDIACSQAFVVPAEFHPRYSATGKLYSYRLLNRALPSPFIGRYAWQVPGRLDLAAMREASEAVLGEHDFAAFCAAGSSVRSTVREVRRLDWQAEGESWEARIEGDGFLYRMIRIIIGTVVEVGLGRRPAAAMGAILASRERRQAGATAPSRGLHLLKVYY